MAAPLGSEPEIAFISGVSSNATVAPISFGSWVAAGALNPATYDPINSVTTKWGSTTLLPAGAPADNVSFWFDTASNWQPIEMGQWLSAMALWSAVANITFAPAANAASADFILYRQPNQPDPAPGTYQQFPNLQPSTIGSYVESPPGAGAFITIGNDTAPLNGSFETQGGDSYFALVHELGHLIGLGHGGPYNNNANPATQQFSAYDMQLYAIMSYIRPFEHNALFLNQYPDEVKQTDWGISADGTPRWPTTPMMLDILAAQRLYGLPTSGPLSDGGDVFGFNTNIDVSIRRYFDFTVNQNPVITIWDGGLNNTLDLSGWSTPARINLEPGSFSSANGQINNIAIASDTVIETAIGGGGPDQITGNSHANFLFGNGDNDTINGLSGNDMLDGGAGNDVLDGDDGNDTLNGDDGNDFLQGNAGNDTVFGGTGDDLGTGGAGDDTLYGFAGDDHLIADAGSDILIGQEGNDNLEGRDGNDYLYGGLGNDGSLVGGAGNESIVGGEGNDILIMGEDNDTGLGEVGNDYIYAGNGNDSMYGGTGYDVLFGEVGNDFLFGGGSNIALGEADYLFGGAGADVFGIENIAGANVIENFNRGEKDLISIQGTNLRSFADVLANTTDYSSFSVITISPMENIWVIGQASATFQPTDFAFS